jgi:hypothetical protein
MTTKAEERLALALKTLAEQIASAPRSIIGMQVCAVDGPGATGNVSGLGGPDPTADVVRELRDAAVATRNDKGYKSWVPRLLSRVGSLAYRAVDFPAIAGVQEALKAAFG